MKALHLTIIAVLAIGISTGTAYAHDVVPDIDWKVNYDSVMAQYQALVQDFNKAKSDLTTMNNTVAQYEHRITQLQESIQRYVDNAAKLSDIISVQNNQILTLETRVKYLESQKSTTDTSELTSKITTLESQVTEQDAKIAELKEDKQNKNTKIDELRDKLKVKGKEIKKLEAKIDRKDTKLDNKNEKLGAMKTQMSEMQTSSNDIPSYQYLEDNEYPHVPLEVKEITYERGGYDRQFREDAITQTYTDVNGNTDNQKRWIEYTGQVIYHKYIDEDGLEVLTKWDRFGNVDYHRYNDGWFNNGTHKDEHSSKIWGKYGVLWSEHVTKNGIERAIWYHENGRIAQDRSVYVDNGTSQSGHLWYTVDMKTWYRDGQLTCHIYESNGTTIINKWNALEDIEEHSVEDPRTMSMCSETHNYRTIDHG